jgi:Flp pilus assembly protein TadD
MLPPANMVATENSPRKIVQICAVAGAILLAGCTPPGPRAALQGDELLRRGKPAEAVAKLKFAAEELPEDPRVWNLLGLAYHQAGQPELAAQAYRQALARDRSNVVSVAHFNLGCLMLEQNHLAVAIDELRSYTLITNDLTALLKLGTAQLRARQLDAAERTFAAVLRLSPKNAEAYNGVGVIHVLRGQRDAWQYFGAALQQEPKFAPALLNSALIAQAHPTTRPAALQRFRDYLAVAPASPEAERVKLLVRHWENELAPKPVVPSNVVTQTALKSNALAAVIATANVVAAAQTPAPRTNVVTRPPVTPVTNTPPVVARTTAPPTVAKALVVAPASNPAPASVPAPATNIPVTVVAVTTAPPPAIAPALPPVVTPVARPVAQPPPPAEEPAIASTPQTGGTRDSGEKRTGLFSRLNPFRDRPKTPPPTNDVPRSVVLRPATNAAPAPKPTFSRYKYLSPSAPPAGNRQEAERALALAAQAQRAGNMAEATRLYQAAAAADGSFFEVHYNSAAFALQRGDTARALRDSELALALEPNSINARFNFALALKQANYPVDAAVELEKVVAASPNEARAHLALGNLYAQQLGETAKAKPHYLKVLELDPRNPQGGAIRFWLASH